MLVGLRRGDVELVHEVCERGLGGDELEEAGDLAWLPEADAIEEVAPAPREPGAAGEGAGAEVVVAAVVVLYAGEVDNNLAHFDGESERFHPGGEGGPQLRGRTLKARENARGDEGGFASSARRKVR